ncbi:MAG: ACT domain-containing protein [bacterium]|nr:ACT domain-containing protein [bacterium]
MKDLFKNTTVRAYVTPFTVATVSKIPADALAVINDHRETTVVIATDLLPPGTDVIKREDGWQLFTFELSLPFEVVGFLAQVSTALAKAGISIFVLSSYSTDHILVKADHRDQTISVLTRLGCRVVDETVGQ